MFKIKLSFMYLFAFHLHVNSAGPKNGHPEKLDGQ